MKKEMISVLKFAFSSFSSYIGEIFVFILIISWLKPLMGSIAIIIASIIGRVCSAVYCYYCNSRWVFTSSNSSTIAYYALIVMQMLVSTVLVFIMAQMILIKETYIKMLVDMILFIISYFIQKKYIFPS